MDLRARWLAIGGDDETFADVVARYREPHRAYHTLAHVEHVLATIDEIRSAAGGGGDDGDDDDPAVTFAAILHDVVYDPAGADNEARSADYARATLARLAVDGDVIERTAELILATARHEGPPGDDGLDALLDADLSTFADDDDGHNGEAIRAEYAFVPEADFVAGRRRVLQRFLDREPLYRTPWMRERYEARAKENIRRAMARLDEISPSC